MDIVVDFKAEKAHLKMPKFATRKVMFFLDIRCQRSIFSLLSSNNGRYEPQGYKHSKHIIMGHRTLLP